MIYEYSAPTHPIIITGIYIDTSDVTSVPAVSSPSQDTQCSLSHAGLISATCRSWGSWRSPVQRRTSKLHVDVKPRSLISQQISHIQHATALFGLFNKVTFSSSFEGINVFHRNVRHTCH